MNHRIKHIIQRTRDYAELFIFFIPCLFIFYRDTKPDHRHDYRKEEEDYATKKNSINVDSKEPDNRPQRSTNDLRITGGPETVSRLN